MAVLPENLRQEVEYLESSIQFIAINGPFEQETLQQMRRAIIQHRTVRFRYRTRSRDGLPDETTSREADPYALMYISGVWVLVAYCHLRRDIRHFRLDRMDDVSVLNTIFKRPTDFKIEHGKPDDNPITVRVLFDHATARWVRESPTFFQVAEEEQADGLLVTLKVQHPNEVLNWLLGWGSHVRILEPDSLRETLACEAERMLANYRPKSGTK